MNADVIVTSSSPTVSEIESCQHSGWKQQFGRPTGMLGRLVGHLMAAKNIGMNRLTVEMLDVQPDDRILEVGCGPGTAVQLLAARVTTGFVAGVDLSEVMVKQATRRNRQFIKRGLVELRQGTVSRLPYENDAFTKVCAVNSFHHWPTPEADLREVRRAMREDGVLLLCLRMQLPSPRAFAAPGFTESEVGRVLELVQQVGFR
jgi:ubiquinone/menaquinone biosynthesis C-methylase UbiE